MQITSLTWILTLALIGSDILLYFFTSRSDRNAPLDTRSFDEEVQGNIATLWPRRG